MNREVVDSTDLLLLDLLQEDIPLVSSPWEVIGQRAGLSVAQVLDRLSRLSESGVLRGISPTLEFARQKGMVSTLIALRVPEDRIDEVARVVNRYSEISHNYRREHEYNLWFTIAARSQSRIDEIIGDILSQTGLGGDDLLNLPTERRYKIDVTFPLIRDRKGRQ